MAFVLTAMTLSIVVSLQRGAGGTSTAGSTIETRLILATRAGWRWRIL